MRPVRRDDTRKRQVEVMKIERLKSFLRAKRSNLAVKGMLKNEKGFVLILALVSMMAMTVIGLSLIMNMATDMQLARNEREAKRAFQLADAGINETMARFRLLTTNANYVGELITSGVRTATSTAWPGGGAGVNFTGLDNLNYTVGVTYLVEGLPYCDSNGVAPNLTGNMSVDASTGVPTVQNCDGEVVMYGRDFNLDQSVTSIKIGKYPIYRVLSTGTSGDTTRTIEAYIGASALNTDTEAGLNTNNCVNGIVASSVIESVKQGAGCACDADIATQGGHCEANKTTSDNMQSFLGGDSLSDIAAMADETYSCSSTVTCNSVLDGVNDWGDPAGDTRSTVIYINNGGPGGFAAKVNNLVGRGILVITGDLEIGGGFTYEGLVYVVGQITMSGGGASLNVTGGVMSGGLVNINGGINVNYDQATLAEVGRQNSSKSLIVWRRL